MPKNGAKSGYNEYVGTLGKLFAECPKEVFAAIAVSALTAGGDYLEHAQQRVADEWKALYDAGIVTQRPAGVAAKLARSVDARLKATDLD